MDNNLAKSVWQIIDEDNFGTDDFNDYLTIFIEICNSNQNILEDNLQIILNDSN